MRLRFLLLAPLALTACDLYWNGDDQGDDVVCHTPPAEEFRNPETGECQPFYGGGDDCGPCGPCVKEPTGAGAQPAWPTCYGMCAGLDEYSCGYTPGCHVAYYDGSTGPDDPPPPPMPTPGGGSGGTGGGTVPPGGGGGMDPGVPTTGTAGQFAGCWDIAPLPVTSGNGEYCYGLDAYSCAMHDDCISDLYRGGTDPSTGESYAKFIDCRPEQPMQYSCETIDCGFGYHCEEQCYPCDDPTGGTMGCPAYCSPTCVPDGGSCATIDCGMGYQCVERCEGGGMDPTTGMTPPGVCYPECVQIVNEPGECTGDVWCDSLPPACPSGTTPGILNNCWSGYCIPNSQCGPADPGGCEPATCTVPPPACPAGSTAGTKNGCYTGYCIPNGSCPTMPCEALTDEMSCLSRMECSAVYTGDDCTCTPTGCTCTTQTYDHCETWWF